MLNARQWMTLGTLSFALIGQSNLSAQCLPHGLYLGAFGGSGSITNTQTFQHGTAFFDPALAVDATGNVSSHSTGFGGAHLGYAWVNPCWIFNPAVEFEGYYLGTTLRGTLDAPHTALPEHAFHDSLPLSTGVYLVNTVFSFNIPCYPCIQPYIGGGIGGATLSVTSASSTQVRPAEAGVNHFNTQRNAYDNVFAGQFKAGLSYSLTKCISVFAEYRYLYLGSTNFNFGSTAYTGHVPTTFWNVNTKGSNYNLGAVGIRFSA